MINAARLQALSSARERLIHRLAQDVNRHHHVALLGMGRDGEGALKATVPAISAA